jgi:hypothetical protein
MNRKKNEMDDFIIDGKLTIKELYEIAKENGFEESELFFSVKNPITKQHFSTSHVVDFGKGWSKGSAIMHLTWTDIGNDASSPCNEFDLLDGCNAINELDITPTNSGLDKLA